MVEMFTQEKHMRVRVKLFAMLTRYRPGEQAGTPFEVELPEGARLIDLVNRLCIPPEETKVAFVNGLTQPLTYPLNPGDEVGIFPPIGGGQQ